MDTLKKQISRTWLSVLLGSCVLLLADTGWSTTRTKGLTKKTATFYVSPKGKDSNPGTKEKPFATVSHARDVVRKYKDLHPDENVTVFLREGVYRLTETLVFTTQDSGHPGQLITYAAYPGETAVVCPDVPVTGWKKLSSPPAELPQTAHGHVWVADVSKIRHIKERQQPSPTVASQMDRISRFLSLYVGNRRVPRARSKPFSLKKNPYRQDLLTWCTTFVFPKGTLHNWPDISQGELSLLPRNVWVSNILPLKDVDEERCIGHTAVPSTYPLDRMRAHAKTPSCYVENVLAVLDEPGEWVLDARTNRLYYWPLEDRKPANVVAPVLTELIRVEGEINYEAPIDKPVKNLVFQGLTFMHGDRFPWHGQTGWGLQHDWERFDSPSAMVRFRGAENCEVVNCRFQNAASSGLRLDLFCQRNRIVGNLFEHLGGVAILLAGYGPGTKNVNKQNVVENNYIHHIGEDYHGSPGIFVWQSAENRVAHNLLHDLPYTAICVTGRIVWDVNGRAECSKTIRWQEVGGKIAAKRFRTQEHPYHVPGTWYARAPFLHSRNNIIARNDIHDVMQICGDGNCIYISGAGAGNLVIENYCHDCLSEFMNNVIRCDDDQNETLIIRNIIYRTGGYAEGLLSKGRNHMIENLLIDLRTGTRHRGYIRFYSGDVTGSIVQRNVVYSCQPDQHPTYPPAGMKTSRPKLWDTNADYNVYYSTVDPDWGRRHIKKMRSLYNLELHSLAQDPKFVDLAKQDFRFLPDSPVFQLGIDQPVSLSEVGLQEPYKSRLLEKQ